MYVLTYNSIYAIIGMGKLGQKVSAIYYYIIYYVQFNIYHNIILFLAKDPVLLVYKGITMDTYTDSEGSRMHL